MNVTNSWENKSSIRNRPARRLVLDEQKYFFPIMEQPLCLHPLVKKLGEASKKYILIQSAYLFMQNIISVETDVVCEISAKIAKGKSEINFPKEICDKLLTVIIDEFYHAYVANDFITQLTNTTGIPAIKGNNDSSLNQAILSTSKSLPDKLRPIFEIIAVCIAENSITQELVQIKKDPDVNQFFNEINTDHMIDEARHSGIFSEVLTFLWREISDTEKDTIGPLIPHFIYEYLKRDFKIQNDRAILSQLPFTPEEIETILFDTHPPYTPSNFRLINPIVNNIINLLRKSEVLSHPKTGLEFKHIGYYEPELDFSENHRTSVHKNFTPWKLHFLRCPEKHILQTELASQSISLNSTTSLSECYGLFISYILEVTQNDEISFVCKTHSSVRKSVYIPMSVTKVEAQTIGEYIHSFETHLSSCLQSSDKFDPVTLWIDKLPLLINCTDTFNDEIDRPHLLHVHFTQSSAEQLQLLLYYRPSYYKSSRIIDLLENFSYYFDISINNRSIHQTKIPLVCPKQREKLLSQPPKIEKSIESSSILSFFSERVRSNPNQLAVIDNGKSLSYQEIDQLSDDVATFLIHQDLKKGTVIAIIHEYSHTYVPLILGIMKAGMVYLSLPEDHPIARLQAILNDANAALIIIDRKEHFETLCSNYPWVSTEEVFKQGKNVSKIDLTQFSPHAENLACIIYTSGSTGSPKGVMIKHSSLAHFAFSATSTFPITSRDRLLQFSIYSFDASLAEISNALVSGATLCVRTKSMLDSSAQFFDECEQLKITVLNLPTPLWTQLVQDMARFSLQLPPTLTTVLIYGEKVTPEILEIWYQNVSNAVKLINTYGPTETTIAASSCDLGHYPQLRSYASLIGHSLGNTRLYLLDRYHRLLPIGAVGELYIGGPGVSPGYIKDPHLSSLRFLTDIGLPTEIYSATERMYKTGDQVQWLENELDENEKLLAFIGRDDRQIKIRGHRVELSEIEVILNSHPAVQSSLVIYRTDVIHPTLVAFVILHQSSFISTDELQSYVQETLPTVMHLSRIHILQQWPTTIRGKIDKNILIKLLDSNSKSMVFTDQVEEKLATIWREVLAIENIDSNSHFFHLGGHSLLAMRLVGRMNSEFHTNLTIRNIMETPIFNQVAKLIQQSNQKQLPTNLSPTLPITAALSSAQQSMWLVDRLQNGHSIQYNIAYAIHFVGPIDKNALEESLNHIIQRHPALRSIFTKKENQVEQLSIEQSFQLNLERITRAEFSRIAVLEARTPFNLTLKPPLHIRLFLTEDTHQYILLVNHHHIIHDGHSIHIFIKELKTFYDEIVTNKRLSSSTISTQYKNITRIQNELSEKCIADSLSYWHNQLKGYKPLVLPFRKPARKLNPSLGENYQFVIESQYTNSLRLLCNQADCTLFSGLFSVLTLLFHRYCSVSDIAVGSIMSTRNYQSDENIIDIFVNTVILRNCISSTDSFSSLLKKVQKTLLAAFAHRFTTLESITRSTKLERIPNDYTLFDIVIGFHCFDNELTEVKSSSLCGKLEFIDNKTSKFGITIDIFDQGNTLKVRIEYCTELYDRHSIEMMAHDFLTLIREITQ